MLLNNLHSDRRRSHRYIRIGRIVQKINSRTTRVLSSMLKRRRQIDRARFYNPRPKVDNFLTFHRIRIGWQKNRSGHAQSLCRKSDGRPVIACTGSGNLLNLYLAPCKIRGQRIERAPRLERPRRQLRFQFQMNLHPIPRQRARRNRPSCRQKPIQQPSSVANRSKIRQSVHAANYVLKVQIFLRVPSCPSWLRLCADGATTSPLLYINTLEYTWSDFKRLP